LRSDRDVGIGLAAPGDDDEDESRDCRERGNPDSDAVFQRYFVRPLRAPLAT
jgi:hypothetical protein